MGQQGGVLWGGEEGRGEGRKDGGGIGRVEKEREGGGGGSPGGTGMETWLRLASTTAPSPGRTTSNTNKPWPWRLV